MLILFYFLGVRKFIFHVLTSQLELLMVNVWVPGMAMSENLGCVPRIGINSQSTRKRKKYF